MSAKRLVVQTKLALGLEGGVRLSIETELTLIGREVIGRLGSKRSRNFSEGELSHPSSSKAGIITRKTGTRSFMLFSTKKMMKLLNFVSLKLNQRYEAAAQMEKDVAVLTSA